MHEFILSIVFLSIGSFSSVLIYRLPLMESGKKKLIYFIQDLIAPSANIHYQIKILSP